MYICHLRNAGCNNSIRTEIDFRDFKGVCPGAHVGIGCIIGTFLGALVYFLKEMGWKHEVMHIQQGRPNSFINDPVATKEMWDKVKGMHQKLCSVCT